MVTLGVVIATFAATFFATYAIYTEYGRMQQRDFMKVFTREGRDRGFELLSFLERYKTYILLFLIIVSAFFLKLFIFVSIAAAIPFIIKKNREMKIKNEILKNFPNAVHIMKMGAKAGLPLHGAIRNVMEYSTSFDIRDVFRRIYHASSTLGEDIRKVIDGEGKRLNMPDLMFLASLIEAHQETGGNLVEMLDIFEEGLRRMSGARGKISSLTAEGRVSAIMLSLIPPVLVAIMAKANPGYLKFFLTSEGRSGLILAAVFYLSGLFLSFRIARVKV